MNNRPHFAARSALALAAVAALGAAPLSAWSLGLGRLSVQSALGEGMRAEIDITTLSPEEASTLQVRIASPEAYRAAGVDYNAVLATLQAGIVRRADGRAAVRLSGDRAVQEPFVEVILELSWASGRMVREYTLLFDPPGSRNAPPPQAPLPVQPQIAAAPRPAETFPVPAPAPVAATALPATRPAPAAPAASRETRVSQAPAPVAPAVAKPREAKPMPAPSAAPAPSPAERPAPMPVGAGAAEHRVRPGESLSRIASRHVGNGVVLDQMLAGLYSANPDAFINANINKLRAGSTLKVPGAEQARSIEVAEARRLIVAQSQDFGAYRGKLAAEAPPLQATAPSRQAQGTVQAAVDDRKQAAAATPDKLKLSSGAAKANAPEVQASQTTERRDQASRVAELQRNVDELKKLQQGTAGGPAAAPAAAQAPAAVPATPPGPTPAAPAAPVAEVPASVPPVATLPASQPRPKPAAAPAPAEPETGLLDSLSSNPLLLPGAGVLAVLLAGFAAWRLRGRFQKAGSETSFLESRMQPDSFFGQSGGQRVDTREAASGAASSMSYSLSQLDAIGDVDPVAEADVYLAYGRDLQAEEILKEAMRATPDRLAVRTKLLEVYAKRRDTKGFELLATQLYALTKGVGADWARAQELGTQIDPDNQLYQPGGHPEEIILDGERVVVEPLSATTMPHALTHAQSTLPPDDPGALPTQPGAPLDLDLDLDLDLGDIDNAPTAPAELTQPITPSAQRPTDMDRGLDFDFADSTQPGAHNPQPRTVPADLDFDSMSLGLDDDRTQTTVAEVRGAGLNPGDSRFPPRADFDAQPTAPVAFDSMLPDDADPLARKLELAEEFRQIGDLEGARDLVAEVVSKAQGALRAKAQAMLDSLG